jgi:pentatricopeptide repeat protein
MNFLRNIISNGHQPDVMTYMTLLDGLCKEGEIEIAIDFLDNMISNCLECGL